MLRIGLQMGVYGSFCGITCMEYWIPLLKAILLAWSSGCLVHSGVMQRSNPLLLSQPAFVWLLCDARLFVVLAIRLLNFTLLMTGRVTKSVAIDQHLLPRLVLCFLALGYSLIAAIFSSPGILRSRYYPYMGQSISLASLFHSHDKVTHDIIRRYQHLVQMHTITDRSTQEYRKEHFLLQTSVITNLD